MQHVPIIGYTKVLYNIPQLRDKTMWRQYALLHLTSAEVSHGVDLCPVGTPPLGYRRQPVGVSLT